MALPLKVFPTLAQASPKCQEYTRRVRSHESLLMNHTKSGTTSLFIAHSSLQHLRIPLPGMQCSDGYSSSLGPKVELVCAS